MDVVCSSDILRGRPFGGIATFINRKYSQHLKLVVAEPNFLVVQCCGTLLINVYFPCCTNSPEYHNNYIV